MEGSSAPAHPITDYHRRMWEQQKIITIEREVSIKSHFIVCVLLPPPLRLFILSASNLTHTQTLTHVAHSMKYCHMLFHWLQLAFTTVPASVSPTIVPVRIFVSLRPWPWELYFHNELHWWAFSLASHRSRWNFDELSRSASLIRLQLSRGGYFERAASSKTEIVPGHHF